MEGAELGDFFFCSGNISLPPIIGLILLKCTYLARCTCNCVECREGEFTDSENHLPECRRCLQCQANDGKKTKTNCTITHDTVCSCLENFYSTTNGNECRKCAECNAETDEVEQPCTETQDTVCRKKVHSSVNPAAIVIPIFLVLGAIAGIVGYLCIKKKYCRHIVLTEEHLQMIVMEVEPKIYHQLGISLGQTEPMLQQIRADYHDNIKQQGYHILYSWLQAHGKKGAFPALINTFRKLGYVTTAENIVEKLIPKQEGTIDTSTLDGSENDRVADMVL
ncbi:hypothetical protein chiPu_0004383 [Chiloscyllium punctatum]|uniref:Uncharacterized protein n=1 Tax=Chiloscyllium punctatum TaxID=137246 RepID=A0A401S6E9_CHIPU|nr:hypothetical protein [Chiloscyllium punctatum]